MSLYFVGEGVQEFDEVVSWLLSGLSLAMDQLTCALSSLTNDFVLYEVHFESLSTTGVFVQKEVKLPGEAFVDLCNAIVDRWAVVSATAVVKDDRVG